MSRPVGPLPRSVSRSPGSAGTGKAGKSTGSTKGQRSESSSRKKTRETTKSPASAVEQEWTIDDEMRTPHGQRLLDEIRAERRRENVREYGCDCDHSQHSE